MGRIKVRGEDSKYARSYIDYKFVDGPYEGEVAFSLRRELMPGLNFENVDEMYGICVRGNYKKQVVFDGFVIVNPEPKNEAVIKSVIIHKFFFLKSIIG